MTIPWMKISISQPKIVGLRSEALAGLLLCGLAIHLLYLGLNFCAASALRLSLELKKSVVIMCSQKTLPTAMTVVSLLPDGPDGLGDLGLVALPCILSHLVQLFVDAVIASKWAQYSEPSASDGPKDGVRQQETALVESETVRSHEQTGASSSSRTMCHDA